MGKKVKESVLLLISFFLVIIFLVYIYDPYYSSLPQTGSPGFGAAHLQGFLDPVNLGIFLSILFFVGLMLILLFETG